MVDADTTDQERTRDARHTVRMSLQRASWPCALVLAVVALLVAGCESGRDEGATTDESPTETETGAGTQTGDDEASGTTVRVYLVRGEHVGPVARVAEGEGVLRKALEELVAGPTPADTSAGLTTAVPSGVEVLDVAIDDGTATIDLSEAFDDGGGSLGMFLRLAQLVHTATQFASVERVALRLDGKPVTTFSSEGIELPETLTRADVADQAPAILVESPLPGQRITSPLRVRGTANTFEATVEWQLVGADGTVIASGFTTATCGTGCRGSFTIEEAFTATGAATLRVFERSAKDSSETKVVEIPVELGAV
jgi:spore germination protein GerM